MKTLIDLFFTNRPGNTIKSGVDHNGISNHSLIYIHSKISISRNIPKVIYTRQSKHYNSEAFRSDLLEILRTHPNVSDPNILWNDSNAKFLPVADTHAPPVTRRFRSEYASWHTTEINNKIYNRDFLKKKAVKTGSERIHKANKEARNDLNKLVKNAKASYYENALNQCNKNPKEMWKTINKLTNKKSQNTKITELKVSGESITKPDFIADALKTYFNEIGPYSASNLPDSNTTSENYISPCDTSFEFSESLPSDVHGILSMTKTSKATGHDIFAESLTV